jgi:hypothetical protein
MWQITGNVLLSNADPSNDAEAEAVRVIATPINRASGSTVQAVTVNATCPTKSGRIFVARAPAQVNCSYSIMVPDAGSWTVTAAAALPKGGRTDSKNTLPVAFSRARVSESGSCAFVSEKLSWSGRVKLAAPKPVGVALPSKETKICATTVYQYHLSVGPFSDTSCGAYQVRTWIIMLTARHAPNLSCHALHFCCCIPESRSTCNSTAHHRHHSGDSPVVLAGCAREACASIPWPPLPRIYMIRIALPQQDSHAHTDLLLPCRGVVAAAQQQGVSARSWRGGGA